MLTHHDGVLTVQCNQCHAAHVGEVDRVELLAGQTLDGWSVEHTKHVGREPDPDRPNIFLHGGGAPNRVDLCPECVKTARADYLADRRREAAAADA